MLQRTFFSLLMLFGVSLSAQVVSIDYVLNAPVVSVPKVKIPKGDSILTLAFDFGKSEIEDEKKMDSLRKYYIGEIDLVYTEYRQSETFSQGNLNRERLEFLKSKVPFIFENNLIVWKLIEQTGAKTDDVAKQYFHGFIVYFKSKKTGQKFLTTAEEISSITATCEECLVHKGDTIFDPRKLSCSAPIPFDTLIQTDTISKVRDGIFAGKFIPCWYDANIKKGIYHSPEVEPKMLRKKTCMIDTILTVKSFSIKKKKKKIPGQYFPLSKAKQKQGITYTNKTLLNRKPYYIKIPDTTFVYDSTFISLDTSYIVLRDNPRIVDMDCLKAKYRTDSVVIISLRKMKDFNHTILVEDLTSSMNPYTEQTLLWRSITVGSTDLSKFIFFNDGDGEKDERKVIGKTGGVYFVNSDNIDTVENKVKMVMRNGDGGDCPENNMEAILKAIQSCPGYHILMIADNNAPIKDIELLTQVHVPIDIILCGVVRGEIQATYMNLARATGGTIYTMDQELKAEFVAAEGTRVKIGDQYFIIKNGQFEITR
jgi:hypothetical protein